jgi:hypothetical protein
MDEAVADLRPQAAWIALAAGVRRQEAESRRAGCELEKLAA